jgi:hypothetical protein
MSARLGFAEGPGGAAAVEAEMAAFLGRLIRWDKTAVVRLRSAEGEPALGVFGHPPFGDVLAVKSMALRGGGIAAVVDATVSAGELLEAVAAVAEGGELTVPPSVTGPAWAGLLPPRAGWRRLASFDATSVRMLAVGTVAEFRQRSEALVPEQRTRAELDALAEELWQRPLPGAASGLTLRVVHAAHALGFLPKPSPAADSAQSTAQPAAENTAQNPEEAADEPVAVLAAGPWLRLRTGYGSVAVRGVSAASGLTVSPA